MNIAIIGAGIGGLATAVALHRLGVRAYVYEQAASFQPIGAGIGIGSNAMVALQQLKIAQEVLAAGMPLHEQRFLDEKLQVMNTIDFTRLKELYGEETIAIQRANLHQALYQALDSNYIHLKMRATSFIQDETSVTVIFNEKIKRRFDYVIAADGLNSLFRQTLLPKSKRRYAGYTCWRGITKGHKHVKLHVSSEAWSPFGRFGWAPLKDDSIYWFACINAPENHERYKQFTKKEVANHFSQYSTAIKDIILHTEDEYFLHHDLYDIRPLKKFVFDRVVLLGDAAHATTPNMGQGAGQAIEDAYILYQAIQTSANFRQALKTYEARRWIKAKKVISLSRKIGWIAQWENPLLVKARNFTFPLIPKKWLFWRLTFLFKDH